MGKVCFSKILRYTCLAAIAVAAAFIAAITFVTPASADPNGGRENRDALKEWDTDNLSRFVSSSFGRAGARNYRIPYHNYKGYFDTTPAKPCIQYLAVGSNLVRSFYDGSCPSGYSLLTRWCSYSNGNVQAPLLPAGQNTYNSAQGRWVSGDRAYDACPSGGQYNPPSLVVGNRHPQLCVGSGWILSLSWNCATRATASRLQHAGCQSAVADAFFQTGGDTGAVNDFPVLEYGTEEAAATVTGTGERDIGCADFAEQQDRLVSSMNGNGGWYLDSEGNLRKNAGEVPSRVLARPAAVYGTWAAKGASYYYLHRYISATFSSSNTSYENMAADDSSYDLRADQRESLDVGGAPLWERVLTTVAEKWNTRGNCSAVIGATRPADIRRAREIAGPNMVFLVPGIGAQGGDVKAVVQADPSANLVINSSRSITNSPHPNQAAAELQNQISQAADS